MIPALPAALAPPAPFPPIVSQSRDDEFVAPGVRRAEYRLQTAAGPLAIDVIAIDPHQPTLRIGSVLANDRLISAGETVSSMAKRTGAVAGVNADYFDIGQTNQPLNLLVRGGALVRTPSKRIVLDVRRDGSVHFDRASFSGTVRYGATTMPLTTVNEFPPQGGAGYLDASYGALRGLANVTVAALVPAALSHDATAIAGSYRVASVDDARTLAADPATAIVAGPSLAFGPAALAIASPPAAGDTVSLDFTLTPSLADTACAVGGGPLLVSAGAPATDPFSPAPEERDVLFPVSGAATLPSGELLLASVDGRDPARSIGISRPQFAALMIGLGASDAMAFDSGGSAETVARVLGDRDVSVLGEPSDGRERLVADGLFVYDDSPVGPPARLVVRPKAIVALPGVDVAVQVATTDAAGHPLSTHLADRTISAGATSRVAVVRADGLAAKVAVDVVARPASLAISSSAANPDPGARVQLAATALDGRGRTIALGNRVRWTASNGTVAMDGTLVTGRHDVNVTAVAAGVNASATILVGRHTVGIPQLAAPATLAYDFANVRAAYAPQEITLPGTPLAFGIEVAGDGSGVGLRAAFINVLGEKRALTLAPAIDWTGWRMLSIPLPHDLNPPVRLVSIYAVDGLSGAPAHRAGSLSFRNGSALVAGTP